MGIRVLGCSGAIAAGCRTTAFLLDQAILIDAGTGVGDLTLDELSAIDHIFLSHSHLDHVLGIPLLADSVMRRRGQRPPITVYALPETLHALRSHIFNGTIWPDFTRIPCAAAPVLRLQEVQVGEVVHAAGRDIEVLSAAHTVPAVGFAVAGAEGHWVYTGDTGPNPALWARLQQLRVCHLVIETAFPDEEQALAGISGHLFPAALGRELQALSPEVTVYITHTKPGDTDRVMAQVHAPVVTHRVSGLQAGQVMAFA